jgi:hypothetical protein
MDVVLERRDFAVKLFQIRKDHSAQAAVFERDGAALVFSGCDGIHAQQVARHREAGNLLVPVAVADDGFYKAAVDYIQYAQRRSSVMQILVVFSQPTVFDPVAKATQVMR